MSTYDFEGMFGDRYSTEQAINDAMFEEVLSFGQLDRTKYAPMTASTYYQAAGGGTPLGSMLKQAHPMMKRQNLLDEIKKKYPDPRTPKELYDLAAELSTNGFGDLSMQIRQVAMEMEKNEATKAYQSGQLKKPSESQLKMLPTKLRGIMGSAGIENKYLQLASTEDKNFSIFNPNQWGGKNNTNARSDWTAARKRHIADIEQMVLDFANHKQGVAGWNIDHITAAIADDDALKNEFIAYIKSSSNRPHAKMLLDAMGVPADAEDGGGGDGGGDGDTKTTDTSTFNKTNFPLTWDMNEGKAESSYNILRRRIQDAAYEQSNNPHAEYKDPLKPSERALYKELESRYQATLAQQHNYENTMPTDEQLKSNVEQRVKNLSLEEQQALYQELEVKGWQPNGTFFLMREEAALYEFLKRELGMASASWMD